MREPHLGRWALPGGPLRADESLREAARRNLAETTGLDPAHLEQLYTFGAVDRGAADRVVSVVYWALVRTEEVAATLRTDDHVAWFPAEALPPLAFDHDEIVGWAVKRLKAKLEYTHLSHALLPDEFTLGQLREVHEAILGRRLDPANFRRRVEATGTVDAHGRPPGRRAPSPARAVPLHRPRGTAHMTPPPIRPGRPAASRSSASTPSPKPTAKAARATCSGPGSPRTSRCSR